jgi:phage terminase small subunit
VWLWCGCCVLRKNTLSLICKTGIIESTHGFDDTFFCFDIDGFMSRKRTNEDKEFEGTLKKSRVTTSKTEPLKRMVKPAFELTEEGNRIFKETIKMLMTTEAVTALDVFSVTMFAYWMAIFIKTDKEAKGTFVQVFKNGTSNITGTFSVIKEAHANIQYYLKVLGLTIKDRGTIMAFAEPDKDDDDNPLDAIAEMLND